MSTQPKVQEAKFKQPEPMFHGTSSTFLPQILSQGVLPNPRKKVWADDPSLMQTSFSRASLEGSYWTSNLLTATSSARNATKKFGGDSIVVIADISTQSAYADEDNLNSSIRNALEKTNQDLNKGVRSDFLLPLADVLLSDEPGAKKARQNFAQHLHQALAVDAQRHPVDQTLLDDLLDLLILRELAWEKKNTGSRTVAQWVKNMPETLPSVEAIDQRLQSVRERLTRQYRKTAQDQTRFNPTLRMNQAVGFRGGNKIKAILAEPKWEWHKTSSGESKLYVPPWKLLYGNKDNLPEKFFQQYETRIGKFPGLVDAEGKTLLPSMRDS